MSEFSESKLYLCTLATAILFFVIFSGLFPGPLDFWSQFSIILLVLLTAGLKLDPLFGVPVHEDFKKGAMRAVLLGLISAAVLYGIFWTGNRFIQSVWPEISGRLDSIYALKSGSGRWRVGIFLALIIGPGEELWWRGFLQRHWMARLGKWPGMLTVSLLYAAVHLGSGNPLLVLAALAGGLWWGYQYLKFDSLLSNIISHTVWDLLVFITFPFA